MKKVIEEYDVSPENMYNMDESGFSIGEVEASKCIINVDIRQKFQKAKPGRQEWVTSVECICADGTAIPPLIIFKGESLSRTWIPANTDKSWCFSHNSKGWTSNLHGLEWLQRCFDPTTREKVNGAYRMLICDGHDSHITSDFIEFCMDNNILLMILPPHSSHLTQPLDVGVFGALKKHMASKLEPLLHVGISCIQKVEWTAAFIEAHQQAFRAQNILSSFHDAGIHPYQPSKVLRQVSNSTPHQCSTCINPLTPSNPFNSAVMTSSSTDMDAF